MKIYSGAAGHDEFIKDLLRGESVGWDNEEEMHPRAKAAQKRLTSKFGCASVMVYGWLGMAVAGAAVIGVLNILRVLGR